MISIYPFLSVNICSFNQQLPTGSQCSQPLAFSVIDLITSLNRFWFLEIRGTQSYTFLVIIVFIYECVNVDDEKRKTKKTLSD